MAEAAEDPECCPGNRAEKSCFCIPQDSQKRKHIPQNTDETAAFFETDTKGNPEKHQAHKKDSVWP